MQQALLKIIEGTQASVPPQGGRKHPNQEMLQLDTTNILFILGGAFVGLDKIIEQRTAEHSMGFGSNVGEITEEQRMELLNLCTSDDLVKFGIIPELIGRMPITVALKDLQKDDLISILTEPKNAITTRASFNSGKMPYGYFIRSSKHRWEKIPYDNQGTCRDEETFGSKITD